MTHSMGCRIPYHFVQHADKKRTTHNPLYGRLKNFLLIGGHIKRDDGRPWYLFPLFFHGKIHNLYNPKDAQRTLWHKAFGGFDHSSCGRKKSNTIIQDCSTIVSARSVQAIVAIIRCLRGMYSGDETMLTIHRSNIL